LRLLLYLWFLVAHARVGTATTFWSVNDPGNPVNTMGCTGRVMVDSQIVAAHRTYPCRSKLWVYNLRTGLGVVVTVLDRGPRHAEIDISRGAAGAIRSNGMELVVVAPVGPGDLF
jgi:rare lipoprotein A (peptidoglycan hydrolase)